MANGLEGVSMNDTIEYFSLFHVALSEGGVWELLYTMFFTMVVMIGMLLVYEKLMQMLKRVQR